MKTDRKVIIFGILSVAAFSASLVEVLAYKKGGIYSIIASRVWLGWMIYFSIRSIFWIIKVFSKDLRKNNLWGLASFLIVILLISFKVNSVSIQISGDSMQQIIAGLSNWNKPDLGINQTAFLGFPSRQYLLPSLPTLIGGPSIFNYRIMYLIIFLWGILTFYAGLRTYYCASDQNNKIAALAILATITPPVIPLLLRVFDMPSFPFSWFFLSLGALLVSYKTQKITDIIAFAWTAIMLSVTYTPALAGWVLITLASMAILWKQVNKKQLLTVYIWFLCFAVSLTFGISSIKYREDIRGPKINSLNRQESITKISDAVKYFFVKDINMYKFRLPFIGPILFLPAAVYLLGAILFFWGKTHFVIMVWSAAVLVVSALSPGYSNNPLEWSMYRTVVILPILLLGIFDVINRQKIQLSPRLFYLLFIVFAVYNTATTDYLFTRSAEITDPQALLLRNTIKIAKEVSIDPAKPIQLGIFTSQPSLNFMPHHIDYFFPKHRLLSPNTPCLSNVDFNQNAIIYFDNRKCLKEIKKSGKSFFLGSFTPSTINTLPPIQMAVYSINL